ncbi:MAG: hypothetical protein AAGF96_03965 [Bacteroidota bacterium]
MEEKRVAVIVRKVYETAIGNCVSHKYNALANYVEKEVFENHKKNISYRTVERAFTRYIDGNLEIGPPQPESVDLFCKFLGYRDYADYVKNNGRRKWSIAIKIALVFGSTLLITMAVRNLILGPSPKSSDTNQCMAWADSLYVKVPCHIKPYSEYGTKVEPLDPIKLLNFKKVEVDGAFTFFSEDDKPLVWYYKNKEGQIEYYTAPGLHPLNGKTLDEITEYIIDKYVPIHVNREDSFIE